jgi:hypothetical protein
MCRLCFLFDRCFPAEAPKAMTAPKAMAQTAARPRIEILLRIITISLLEEVSRAEGSARHDEHPAEEVGLQQTRVIVFYLVASLCEPVWRGGGLPEGWQFGAARWSR